MKQVLFLGNLIEEEVSLAPAVRSTDAHDERVNDDVLFPTQRAFVREEEVPQKNTFIHYEIDKSPRPRPPTPTSSAPGAMLSRLFKIKPQADLASDAGLPVRTPSSSACSDSSYSSMADSKATQTDDLGQDSEPSATGIFLGSPIDVGTDSKANFVGNGSAALVEMHRLGQCTPCNYFWYKMDGCRQGGECSFCHFCPKGEIKKRKKDKMRQLRRAGVLRR